MVKNLDSVYCAYVEDLEVGDKVITPDEGEMTVVHVLHSQFPRIGSSGYTPSSIWDEVVYLTLLQGKDCTSGFTKFCSVVKTDRFYMGTKLEVKVG